MMAALEGTEQARIEIRTDECKGCGLCVHVCPVDYLVLQEALNSLGYTAAQYLGKGCTGCSICFYVCPEPGVLTVFRQERSSVPKSAPGGLCQNS
jgi:Pyruvate/2-oxoacid:ferredoxin oxidoreductase delta subunit